MTSEYCPKCEEESERQYEEFNKKYEEDRKGVKS